MSIELDNRPSLSDDAILQMSSDYTVYEWGMQHNVDPIIADHAQGVYVWDTQGKRYLDFNSQLMCVNIGHGDPRMTEAVVRQMEKISYVSPRGFITEARARAGAALASVLPAGMQKAFFTTAGAEAVENAIKAARFVTGRQKVIARYRSYHGATLGAGSVTGEPRRWNSEPGLPWVVRAPDAYPYRCTWCKGTVDGGCTLQCADTIEDIVTFENPNSIAAIIVEPVVGTNGILISPDGYLQRIREICDRHGIMMIADEVMSGFGRTGKWFAIQNWGVQPDIMAVAKGITSGYIPLGATILSEEVARKFDTQPFLSGLTYNSHPVACAAAEACITIMKEDGLVENAAAMGEVLKAGLLRLKEKHPCIGEVRAIGLFSLVELVKDRTTREPLVPFNPPPDQMQAMNRFSRFLRDNGLFTFIRWNTFFCNPPLCITAEQIAEGLAIIDRGLDILDAEVAV